MVDALLLPLLSSLSLPLLSLRESVFTSWGSVLLVLAGFLGIIVGGVAFVQTRTWPRGQTVTVKEPEEASEEETPEAPKPRTNDKSVPVMRPASTTERVRIRFPAIDERHPDVWDHQSPLSVLVAVDSSQLDPGADIQVVLSGQTDGQRRRFGTRPVDATGGARYEIEAGRRGEIDLIAELRVNGEPEGQAVRSIRLVDYRDEIVETFEDFVAWAASQFGFVDRKRTAREFTDMFIDGRPGVPAAPLDTVVDLYEIANFSDHPVDRATYLQLVDAFLDLEEAGALEGTGAR